MTTHATSKERNGVARPCHINYCLKIEVSIMLHCQLCLNHCTTSRIKNWSKRPLQSTKKCHRAPQLYQLLSEKLSIHCASLLAILNPLHSHMNQELFEKHLCILSSHYKMISSMKGSHHVLPPNRHIAVSKYEWDTKEDTGKSMKNALDVLWYSKRHLSGQSNVKQ